MSFFIRFNCFFQWDQMIDDDFERPCWRTKSDAKQHQDRTQKREADITKFFSQVRIARLLKPSNSGNPATRCTQ
jgi:hypothetical protein